MVVLLQHLKLLPGRFLSNTRESARWHEVPASLNAQTWCRDPNDDKFIALALADLRRAFPVFKEEPTHATVTWEKEATPAPTPGFWRGRPGVTTPLANLFLAGDWIDAGLPPTIEAACRSGHRAAAFALRWLDGQKEDECLKPYCSTATA
jgi:uncharacterized protein with NAD-binding domain and iron-sulfur cluster